MQAKHQIIILNNLLHQNGHFRYQQLPFGLSPAGDVLKRKIHHTFKDQYNVFATADNILMLRFYMNGKVHDTSHESIKIYAEVKV